MTDVWPWAPYPEEIKTLPVGSVEVEIHLPDAWHVVMGAAGKTDQEVNPEALAALGVPLYKRKGGGGTVLLGPGTVIVTLHAGVAHPFRNKAYFEAINRALMDVFSTWKDLHYHPRGISDIAVGDRKIVGSSIFRRRTTLLFQASILVDLNLDLMNTLLRHPPREPDYRQGRSHGAFVTCLRELGVTTSTTQMAHDLRTQLPGLAVPYLREVDQRPEF